MIGTIVNVTTIIIGSSIGSIFNKGMKERYQNNVLNSVGLVAISLGIAWISKSIVKSNDPLLFVFSMIIGAILGEFINLDKKIEDINNKYNKGDSKALQGLVTAVLLFCVGTMSILGPIESALNNNHTLLFINAVLDGFTSLMLASTFGITIILSAPILLVWQGSIYFTAKLLNGTVPLELLNEISIIGGILIMTTGLNIVKAVKIKTLNLLPALIIPVIYYIPVIHDSIKFIIDKIFS